MCDVAQHMPTRPDAAAPASPSDREVAEEAVRAAGAVVRGGLGQTIVAEAKTSATDPVTAIDRAAEAAAVAVLARHRPADARLGEETGAAAGTSGRRWTVDALDGTLNFVSGLPLCCCAVGLHDGAGGVAAAILDPVRQELFSGARGEGTWRSEGSGPADAAPGGGRTPDLAGAVVATYLDGRDAAALDGVRAVLATGAQVRILGSGSLELAWVAAGRIDAWIQTGTAPWDWVPGALLVNEAGGVAAALGDEASWHVAASSPDLHAQIARVLAG